ncbi:MAG: hypothetical protein A9Z00_04325 [Thermobacillus sp. ZCTH02-B1]|uniref:hypothetical protein n=1 Tax=Thermobacillus sp. ZCTH02-B1 TaxID=1858795 RepID=UPI000B56D04B|nr:hypothetical protein [Thermobacillus sp. ZCTH02-B1]OUM96810.1 MAG: hypothetical protein A9Z00_04325 [Thermobacillus sp. ZCTH02-B1]
MRMRGFVAGGLLGLAAGIILSRKNPGAIERCVRRAERMMDAARRMMIEQALRFRFGGEKGKEERKTGKSDSGTWSTIRSMISADERVKQEAERILAEAGDAASDKPH